MAVHDVEGSKFTKELTGRHMVVYLTTHYHMTENEAKDIAFMSKGDFCVRLNAADVEELNRAAELLKA